jgi:glycerol-1-phosphate dehydrogenase [NAD(P)+]
MSTGDPHIIVIAEGALGKLDDLLERYKHPLVVTDNLILSKHKGRFEEFAQTALSWLTVEKHSSEGAVMKKDIDVILGFGGGRSLDLAKILAKEFKIDWVAIPTAASHDGIASDVASVMHNGYRYSEKCKSPIAVLADLTMISEAPGKLRLSGIGDVVSKASSLAEWKLAHEMKDEPFDKEVYTIVESALESVLFDDSLGTLVRALVDTGRAMSMFGSSRPCSGTEHSISHAMDRQGYDLHGLQVGFTTPFCVHFLEQAGYTNITPESLIAYLKERAMPTTLQEMGLTPEDFIDNIHHGVQIMKTRNRYSVLTHLEVSKPGLQQAIERLKY